MVNEAYQTVRIKLDTSLLNILVQLTMFLQNCHQLKFILKNLSRSRHEPLCDQLCSQLLKGMTYNKIKVQKTLNQPTAV